MRILLALTLLGAAIGARTLPSTSSFSVIARPTSVEVHGDTVRVILDVRNAATSNRDLFVFTVDAPTPALNVEQLGSPAVWDVDVAKEFGRSVASWGFISPHVAPGRAAPALAFSALGLPGVVRYWAEPWIPADTIESADVPVASAVPGPGNSAADSGVTIGIVPFPADRSRAALLARLGTLLQDACTRGWIDNQGVCTSLEVKIRHGDARALLNELEAQRGKHLNELAYFLLVGNVRALPPS
jgi:hypothetical protein